MPTPFIITDHLATTFVITDHHTAGVLLATGSATDPVGDRIQGPFNAVVSIVGTWEEPGVVGSPPPGDWDVWNAFRGEKLRLVFDDVQRESPHGDPPTEADVATIIEFAHAVWGGKVLLHCGAGVSRSGAAALTLLAVLLGPGREMEAVEHLLKIRPIARPHARMVEYADRLLGRSGALYGATAERMGGRWP
jgi:hypothetical protein